MEQLPLEVITRIIRNNLEPNNNNLTRKSRARELKSYSLISATFRATSQKELFYHPFVQGTGVETFIESLNMGGAQRLNQMVQKLTIWQGDFLKEEGRTALEQLLSQLNVLKKLDLFSVSVNLESLSLAPALESLTFFRGSLYSHDQCQSFKSLEQLHFFTMEPDWTAYLFNPTTFPALSTFQHWNNLSITPFLPLLPTVINYADHSRLSEKQPLKSMIKLKVLELLTESSDYFESLSLLPEPLRIFRVRMGRFDEMDWSKLAKTIEQSQMIALQELEMLWIPAGRDMDEGMSELVEVLKKKKIQLRIAEVSVEFDDWLRVMDKPDTGEVVEEYRRGVAKVMH